VDCMHYVSSFTGVITDESQQFGAVVVAVPTVRCALRLWRILLLKIITQAFYLVGRSAWKHGENIANSAREVPQVQKVGEPGQPGIELFHVYTFPINNMLWLIRWTTDAWSR